MLPGGVVGVDVMDVGMEAEKESRSIGLEASVSDQEMSSNKRKRRLSTGGCRGEARGWKSPGNSNVSEIESGVWSWLGSCPSCLYFLIDLVFASRCSRRHSCVDADVFVTTLQPRRILASSLCSLLLNCFAFELLRSLL